MEEKIKEFYFPKNISVSNPPLEEAWLELRWKLERNKEIPIFEYDPNYPYAIGLFFNEVREKFPVSESLEPPNSPIDLFPYTIKHRFRVKENGWPLLQLGPGIAAVNFVGEYSWVDFKEKAVFLSESLRKAYENSELCLSSITLRFKNTVEFNYSEKDIFSFLKENLNFSISTPNQIPGVSALNGLPISLNSKITYELDFPRGKGTYFISTGKKQQTNTEVIIVQFEISSEKEDTPNLNVVSSYVDWLEKAHSSIHEWFFSSIDNEFGNMIGINKKTE